MIAKLNRFHGHNSLNAVYKHGKVVNNPQMSIKYLPARPGRKYRLSVVVSRKVHKSAVVRNRIRRRLYEAVRLRVVNIEVPTDLVINIYSEQVATMPADDLNKMIDELLAKTDILSGASQPEHAIVNRQKGEG